MIIFSLHVEFSDYYKEIKYIIKHPSILGSIFTALINKETSRVARDFDFKTRTTTPEIMPMTGLRFGIALVTDQSDEYNERLYQTLKEVIDPIVKVQNHLHVDGSFNNEEAVEIFKKMNTFESANPCPIILKTLRITEEDFQRLDDKDKEHIAATLKRDPKQEDGAIVGLKLFGISAEVPETNEEFDLTHEIPNSLINGEYRVFNVICWGTKDYQAFANRLMFEARQYLEEKGVTIYDR